MCSVKEETQSPPMKKILLILILLAVLFSGLLIWAGYGYYHQPNTLTEETTVVIPRGSSSLSIARALAEERVIHYPNVFRILTRLRGINHRLQAGEYRFDAGLTPEQVMNQLVDGDTVKHYFTLPEGLASNQILDLLAAEEGLKGEVPESVPEGTLLPETYQYRYGDTREEIIRHMREAMTALLEEAWPKRDPSVPLLSPEEALILASIVEKETGIAAERKRVAAVFINRLRKGMLLQTDPTVIYAVTNGKPPLKRSLTYADLKHPARHNTYVHPGLPPTPICHPGQASIEAVLHPLKTDELYFVADGKGGHVFASTHKEHNRNVQRWRKIQRQQ